MDRKCIKCKKTKPISNFRKSGVYRIRRCNSCIKIETHKNNESIRKKIKEYAGECWWVEQYCYSYIFYYEGKNRKK